MAWFVSLLLLLPLDVMGEDATGTAAPATTAATYPSYSYHNYNNDTTNSSMKRRAVDISLQLQDVALEVSLKGPYYFSAASQENLLVDMITESDGNLAVHVMGLAPSTTTLPKLSPPAVCYPGTFRLDAFTCEICPWGFWCPGTLPNAEATANACPLGTANPLAGMSAPSACVLCAGGTYAYASGASLCMACPSGFYCSGGAAAPTQCPAHTTTSDGASSAADCACMPDYTCTYSRRVTLQLALNTTMTLQELQSDSGIATTLRDGMLMALGLYGVPGIVATFQGFSDTY